MASSGGRVSRYTFDAELVDANTGEVLERIPAGRIRFTPAGKPLRLNFACGGSRWDGFDNSDTNREPGTTFVDLTKPPYPYPDESAELILISHGLFMGNHGVPLHPDLRPIMGEFFRILRPGGWLRIDDNPFRCPMEDEVLDEGERAAESERGYRDEWKLPREALIGILEDCGFQTVMNRGPRSDYQLATAMADAFDDAVAAIVSNQMGHYSFTIEAQK